MKVVEPNMFPVQSKDVWKILWSQGWKIGDRKLKTHMYTAAL